LKLLAVAIENYTDYPSNSMSVKIEQAEKKARL